MPLRSNTGQSLQNSSQVDQHRVQALQLGIMDPDLICRLSVAQISSTLIYDQATFQPNFNAINDPRMGVVEKDTQCFTCKSPMEVCPGHFGHIALNSPVYHPGLLTYLVKFLRCVCFNCSKLLLLKDLDDQKLTDQKQQLLKIRTPKLRFKALQEMLGTVKKCAAEHGGCGYTQPKINKGSLKIDIEFQDENFDKTKDRKCILWPEECLKVLQKVSNDDCKLMGLNPEFCRPEWTIIKNFAVAPPPVRPSVSLGGNMRSEDDLTYAYQQVLKINNILKEQVDKGANMTIINELKTSLQYHVSTVMDNKIAGQPPQKHKSGKSLKCIRSRLKGKEGRLRGNLMGKRVDFSARTVITPDPNLKLDELGVPFKVAQGLTIPETVTAYNIDRLRLLVSNGPNQWPGAKYIIRLDNRQIDLSMIRCRSDVHLEIGYVVERHLQDGDYVMFNRQPSLHKMSIMGHRVKVLPYSTFRMNLSVTTPYNADFDGDEMNMHVPQSLETMAEIKEIMSVPKQILAPQANKPCMGIVQDSLLGTMLMTERDTFLTKEQVMQLLMWMPETIGQLKLPTPAVIRPQPLWTGKQIFSMLIPRVNLARKKDYCCPKDQTILIVQGELLCGTLNKSIVGATGQGLNHVIIKDFGAQTCADYMSGVQKIVNNWLVYHGFTVGVQDIIVQEKLVSEGIANILFKYKRSVQKIIHSSQSGKLKSQPGKTMKESFEAQVNKRLNDARDKSGNLALEGLISQNRLRNMVLAGSKGSNINISQIMACVGQQNVEGGRIPFGFHRRTLPHYAKDDFGPEAKGFVESSYLSGLKPEELYFHAMGGREGLIDTAVKTAETGYISRRLIKALEDVMVQYDGTVRTSKHELVQFLYGEDGMAGEQIEDLSLDMLKTNNKTLKSACRFPLQGEDPKSDQILLKACDQKILTDLENSTEHQLCVRDEYRRILQDRDLLRSWLGKATNYDDSTHLPVNIKRLLWNAKSQFEIKPNSVSDLTPMYVIQKVDGMISSLSIVQGMQKANKLLIEANLNAKQLFSIQLRYLLCSRSVILQERLTRSAFDWLIAEIKAKFESSIVQSGEMVGAIAAQSLGEPATQMTLNTFHFAGISAKNVTLGVPRFKEIINVNKNIKTPGLKIYMEHDVSSNESKVSKLGMSIEHTTLAQVVSSSSIYYDPEPDRTIIAEDAALVQLYNDVPVLDDQMAQQRPNPWLLRLELCREKMEHKGLRMSMIDKKLNEIFSEQISVMVTDDNSDRHVIRIRLNNIEDDDEMTVTSFIKNEFEPSLLHDLKLKGIPEITKVTFQKIQESVVDPLTGQITVKDENWIIETDGSALAKILTFPKVDATRTVSNDTNEILKVLGVEAARQSLINEMRFVLGSYGIYVNYRHISTLVDVMSLRGRLTSITRSGINRVDSGVLRKCTFEETVEILLEGAVFSEKDHLNGISENIIMGQLGPFGSGSFGVQLDPQVIEEHAKTNCGLPGVMDMLMSDDYKDGEGTPMYRHEESTAMTPTVGMTPSLNGMVTPASLYPMTPAGAGFSPRIDAHFGVDSPGYASPSPGYQNPASPRYGMQGYQFASPIYGATKQTPTYALKQSPGYQHVGSVYAPQQSPIYRAENHPGPYSPTYAPNSPVYSNPSFIPSHGNPVVQSPSYSPSSGLVQSFNAQSRQPVGQSIYSPSYSPHSGLQQSLSGQKSGEGSLKSPYYIPSASPVIKYESSYSASANQAKLSAPAYNPVSAQAFGQVATTKIKEELHESDTD